MSTFAKRVESLRLAAGLNQPELGKLVGATKGLISQIEKGINKEVKMLLLFRLAAALRVSARFLATGTGSPVALGQIIEDESELIWTYRKLDLHLKASLVKRAHELAEDGPPTPSHPPKAPQKFPSAVKR